MSLLETIKIPCPYCAELIEIVVDCSLNYQEYIEDCSVCCQPINFQIDSSDSDDVKATAHTSDEV
jgi:hypothetical protein